eukprot:TRINITY_DN38419_c0_g1_i1.p1 TRINITY_DN38419_c0_g1~~TRINITY_DN38419_c0_g1_i1.p1  ORF type:complete len:201 (-),score=52.54 TRINITY_DN38419_c0_g1_i1:166-768(-)
MAPLMLISCACTRILPSSPLFFFLMIRPPPRSTLSSSSAASDVYKRQVSFHEAFFTSDECFTVMDWARGGELFDWLQHHGPYREHHARSALTGIVAALQHVHSFGVIHRDIKPENLLLSAPDDPGRLLLSDFDMAIEDSADSQEKFGLVGTVGYTAPELGSVDYSFKVDVWSLGVVMYVMLVGGHPWPCLLYTSPSPRDS